MPFDSNGVFSRVMNWTSDQQNGIAIECGRHDQEDDNFAHGFNDCFCRDGRAAATGDFNLGNYKLKNVANGTATTDAVNKGQLDTKANNNAVVHLTGNETIAGTKTFNNEIHFKNSVYVDAAAGDEGGEIEFAKAQNSSLTGNVKLDVFKNSMRIFGPASNGDVRTIINADIEQNTLFIPRSDKTDSAVSTIGINKNQNGYVKLGNGIIIQWGRYDHGSNSAGFKATITLPTPFTNTNYSFSLVGTRQNDDDMTAAVNVEGRAKATTYINFQCSRTSGSSAGIRYIDWLAIGY